MNTSFANFRGYGHIAMIIRFAEHIPHAFRATKDGIDILLRQDWEKLASICSSDFKMYYGDLDPRLGGDKIVSVQDYVAEMSSQTALGDPRRESPTA